MSETLGRYTLVRRVAAGGMAEIWKAKVMGAAGFEKAVAIKRVLPHLAGDREFIDMFVEEAKLVSGLAHPNIVQVFDFGQSGESYYLAMEFVPGCNLDKLQRRLADRDIKLAVPVALYVGVEMCRGLGFAHALTDANGVSRRLVHRDVSPQNVLLSFVGDVKLGDFGIAKAVHVRSRTETGLVRGKSAYMSPEQAKGEVLDHRSDLFSAAIVLYEMIAGRLLFQGESALEVMQKVAAWKAPPAEALSEVPESLREFFATALAGPRERRYADALAMETALSWHLGDGAVRSRQSLGALVRELFADEVRREQADASGNAALSMDLPPEAPVSAASGPVDSQQATVARAPLADLADRARRSQSRVVMLGAAAGLAALAALAGVVVLDKRGPVASSDPSSAPVARETLVATSADLTTLAVAPAAGETLAVLGTSGAASVDPADVDRRRKQIVSFLARRFLTVDDVPEVKADLDQEDQARQDGLLLDAQRRLSDAESRIAAMNVTYQLVSTKLDRVSGREKRLSKESDVPVGELSSSLEEARNLLATGQIWAANESLYRLDRRMDEFDR